MAEGINALLADETFLAAAQWQPVTGWPDADKMLDVWAACWPCLETLGSAGTSEARLDALASLRGAINLQGGKQAAWGGKEGLDACKAALRSLRESATKLLDAIGEPPGEVDRWSDDHGVSAVHRVPWPDRRVAVLRPVSRQTL